MSGGLQLNKNSWRSIIHQPAYFLQIALYRAKSILTPAPAWYK